MTHELDFGPFDPPATNLVGRLAYWAAEQPDAAAFAFLPEGEEAEQYITYAQLHARAQAIADRLTTLNLRGQRALLLYPPGLEFIAALFGCFYAGVVAVPAYPPRRNRNMLRIQAIADDARAAAALTVDEVCRRAGSFFDEAPRLEALDWLATDYLTAETLSHPAAWTPPPIAPGDLAVLQYTSGSTGMPKGVMLTHSNLMHNVAQISRAFHPGRTGVGVSWLPTYHDMGLIGGILNPLFIGRPNVLMPPMSFLARPVRWLQAITRYGAIISGGPNFAYQLCVDRIAPEECQGLDLGMWQVAYNGAEPIRADTIAAFTRKFAPYGFRATAPHPCYGLAEATLIVTGARKLQGATLLDVDAAQLAQHRVAVAVSDASSRRLVSSGAALPDTEIAIVETETGTALASGRVGEIWVKSPSVALGYWEKREATAATFGGTLRDGRSGYLRTGDLGFVHEGELFVTGRLKDLIIVRGVNRYPQDIEQTVEAADERVQHGAVAAFGVEVQGVERLAVVCEVERKRGEDFSAVLSAVRAAVAREHEAQPDAVVLVRFGSLPKTSSGKLQRHACRDAFLDGTLNIVAQWRAWNEETPIADWSSWQDVAASDAASGIDSQTASVVLEVVRNVARERATELSLDTNILEIGLDSLERMEIVAALERTFGGRLPGDVMAHAETCREVIEAVQQYLGPVAQPQPHTTTTNLQRQAESDFREMPEVRGLRATAAWVESLGIVNPFFQAHAGIAGATTIIDGREVSNFSSYNYLGMSGDARVMQAAKAAIDRYGTSVSASRLVSGERPVHRALEHAIAELLGADDAVVFVGGHATNETTIGHLFGPGDLILHDALAHNSIIEGALLSGARRRSFPHNDWRELDALLSRIRAEYRRVLIAIEGVYGMDGDFPDLPQFIELKQRHRALLLVDEAHSLGTMGASGRGIGEHFGVDPRDVDLWMGTLSKSLGSCGGYIAGGREIVEYLRYTAPGFVYSVGISPPNAAAALASIELLRAEPQRVGTLRARAALFLKLAQARGLNTGRSGGTPVVPIILGDAEKAIRAADALLARGFNARPLLPPAVEENAARLRFFITSQHSELQIRQAVEAIAQTLAATDGDISPSSNGNGHVVQEHAKAKSQP